MVAAAEGAEVVEGGVTIGGEEEEEVAAIEEVVEVEVKEKEKEETERPTANGMKVDERNND